MAGLTKARNNPRFSSSKWDWHLPLHDVANPLPPVPLYLTVQMNEWSESDHIRDGNGDGSHHQHLTMDTVKSRHKP